METTMVQPFEQGALLADVFALEQQKTHRLTFSALTDGMVFRIQVWRNSSKYLLEFLHNNPGLFVYMQDSVLVE